MIEARRKARIEIARIILGDLVEFHRVRAQEAASPQRRTVSGLHAAMQLLRRKDARRHAWFARRTLDGDLRGSSSPAQTEVETTLGWLVDQLKFPLVAPRDVINGLEWDFFDPDDRHLDPETIEHGDLILDEARLAGVLEGPGEVDFDDDPDDSADGRRAVSLTPEMSGASSRFANLAIDPGVAVFAENGPTEGMAFGRRPYQRWRTRERRRRPRRALSAEAVISLLEEESGHGIDALRAAQRKGRPSQTQKRLRADLAIAVSRLRTVKGVGAEAIATALRCDRVTVWRLAKSGAELNATSARYIGEESDSVIAA